MPLLMQKTLFHMRIALIVATVLSVAFTSQASARPELDSQLFVAVAQGDVEEVKSLLRRGARVNARDERGRTLFMYAAAAGLPEKAGVEITKALFYVAPTDPFPLRYRTDLRDAEGRDALTYAIAHNAHPAVLKAIVDEMQRNGDEMSINGTSYRAIAQAVNNTAALEYLGPEPVPAFPEVHDIELRIVPNMNSSLWSDAQRTLQRLDLYSSSIDGKPGPMTRRGVIAYYDTLLRANEPVITGYCADLKRFMTDHDDEIEKSAFLTAFDRAGGPEIPISFHDRDTGTRFRTIEVLKSRQPASDTPISLIRCYYADDVPNENDWAIAAFDNHLMLSYRNDDGACYRREILAGEEEHKNGIGNLGGYALFEFGSSKFDLLFNVKIFGYDHCKKRFQGVSSDALRNVSWGSF